MIEEADRDGDGEISEDEFMRIMRKTNLFWANEMVQVGAFLRAASLPILVWDFSAVFRDLTDRRERAPSSWKKIEAANEKEAREGFHQFLYNLN